MVFKRKDGTRIVQASLPDDLAEAVTKEVDGDPELTDGRIVREALREKLEL
jgi:hypothetical protein